MDEIRQNARLSVIIGDVGICCAHALPDDDLEKVSAAGVVEHIRDETMLSIPRYAG